MYSFNYVVPCKFPVVARGKAYHSSKPIWQTLNPKPQNPAPKLDLGEALLVCQVNTQRCLPASRRSSRAPKTCFFCRLLL